MKPAQILNRHGKVIATAPDESWNSLFDPAPKVGEWVEGLWSELGRVGEYPTTQTIERVMLAELSFDFTSGVYETRWQNAQGEEPPRNPHFWRPLACSAPLTPTPSNTINLAELTTIRSALLHMKVHGDFFNKGVLEEAVGLLNKHLPPDPQGCPADPKELAFSRWYNRHEREWLKRADFDDVREAFMAGADWYEAMNDPACRVEEN